jgi:ferrous iron transport protein A
MEIIMKTLIDLRAGEKAVVKRVNGEGLIQRRLRDMGLVTGVSIKMVKPAPLGDPLEFKVRGYHLSLRKTEAKTVEVTI